MRIVPCLNLDLLHKNPIRAERNHVIIFEYTKIRQVNLRHNQLFEKNHNLGGDHLVDNNI